MPASRLPLSALLTLLSAAGAALAEPNSPGPNSPEPDSAARFARDVQPFLKQHCYKCHDAREAQAGFRVDALGTDFRKGRTADLWREVINKINLGEMPPEEEPRPDAKKAYALVEWVGGELRRAEQEARMAGGRIVMRRLNRREYAHTVGDLLRLDRNFVAKIAEELPADGKAEGFDRISAALFFDQTQLEKYLEVADLIAAEAIRAEPPQSRTYVYDPRRHMRNEKPQVPVRQAAEHQIPLGPTFYDVREDGVEMWGGHGGRQQEFANVPYGPRPDLTDLVAKDGYYRVRVAGGGFRGARAEPITLRMVYGPGSPIESEHFIELEGTLDEPGVAEATFYLKAGQPDQKRGVALSWNGINDVRVNNPRWDKLHLRWLVAQNKLGKAASSGDDKLKSELRKELDTVLAEMEQFNEPRWLANEEYELKDVPRMLLQSITVDGPFDGPAETRSNKLVWKPLEEMELEPEPVEYEEYSGRRGHRVDPGAVAAKARKEGVEWIDGVDVRDDDPPGSPWKRLSWIVPDLSELVQQDGQYRITVVAGADRGSRDEPVRIRLYYADATPVRRRVDLEVESHWHRPEPIERTVYLRAGGGDLRKQLVLYWNPLPNVIERTPEHQAHIHGTVGLAEQIEEAIAAQAPAEKIQQLRAELEKNRALAAEFKGPAYRLNPEHRSQRLPRLVVERIEIEGPLPGKWPPESHVALGVEDGLPSTDAEVRSLFARLLPRAYRRPVAAHEVDGLVDVVRAAREEHQLPPVVALRMGLKTMLCSPGFVFIQEPPAENGQPRKLNDFELASRLSYFLWSSLPDAELLEHARQGTLHDSAVLQAQIQRMLDDPRSRRLVEGFAGQWLSVDQFGSVMPAQEYNDYDEDLEAASREEPLAFFAHVLAEDLPITNFIDSPFLVINERLARHYGIEGITGDQFRVVEIRPEHHRGGVLGMAGLLTLLADGTRTLPVRRAAWVRENLLNDPPAPPPPNAGEIQPNTAGKRLTVRERLALHRKEATCASCHAKLDGYGLALENYDAIGAWRIRQNGEGFRGDNAPPIDASGALKSGRAFEDLAGYKAALLAEREKFVRAFCEKMLTYALGRPVGYVDRQTVDQLAAALDKKDDRLRALIEAIVMSEPFQTK